jgi:predicted glutamine amidotransferase
MCGIYGILIPTYKKLSEEERNHYTSVLKQLSIANSKRGEDAVGLFTIGRDRKISTFKKTYPVWKAIFDESWNDAIKITDNTLAVVCHVRERSDKSWNNDVETAHPHITTSIIGVHNGTIRNYKEFSSDGVESDSITLFRFIEEKGILAVDRLCGTMAICYVNFNVNPTIVNFAAYKKPLHFAYENGVLLFSSEYFHLRSVLRANSKILYLSDGVMIRFNLKKGLKSSVSSIPELIGYSRNTDDIIYRVYSDKSESKKCPICNYNYYTETTIRYFTNKVMRKQCISCKPNSCDICGHKIKFTYEEKDKCHDNNLWSFGQKYLCRNCYLDIINQKLLSAPTENKGKCIKCKKTLPNNCMEYCFNKNNKLVKICVLCSEAETARNQIKFEEYYAITAPKQKTI